MMCMDEDRICQMNEYFEYERDNEDIMFESEISQHLEYICNDYESMYPILPSIPEKSVELFSKTFLNQAFSGVTQGKVARGEGHDGETNQAISLHSAAPRGKVGAPAARNMDVADEYLMRRYGDEVLPNLKPEGNVELPLFKSQYWVEEQEVRADGEGSEGKRTKTRTQTKTDRKKRLWTGIDHFTRCDDLYVMNDQQIQVCKYFDATFDKVEEEKSRVEEEVVKEVIKEANLGMLGRKRKMKKRVAKESKGKEDWTIIRGEESDKCVVVEEKADGTRKLVTRNIPVKKQIWSWGRVTVGREEKGGITQLVLFDSGNLSRSLVSIGLIRKLEREMGRKIRIRKYGTTVRGVDGGLVPLVGQTETKLRVKLPGFSRHIYFQPIVSSSPMNHLNLSLVEMKEHQLSLHMLKEDTIIQDYCTQEEQRLFGRNEVHSQGIKQLTASAIVEVVNVLRTRSKKEITTRDLIDQNQVESELRSTLSLGNVLSEISDGVQVFESLEQAWDHDVDIGDKVGALQEPKSFARDLRRAKSMSKGDPVQALHPHKRTTVPPHCHMYVPCKIKASFGSQFSVYPSPETILPSGGLLVTPSINEMRDVRGLAHLSVLNLTDDEIILNKNDTLGYMEILGEEDIIECLPREEEGGDTLDVDRTQVGGNYGWTKVGRDIKSRPPEVGGTGGGTGDRSLHVKSHPPIGDKEFNLGGSRLSCQLTSSQICSQTGEYTKGDTVGGLEEPLTSPAEISPSHKVNKLWGNKGSPSGKFQVGGRSDNYDYAQSRAGRCQQQQQQQQQLVRPASDNYLHSGFILLDEQGNVQKYLNEPEESNNQQPQDQAHRKRDFWGTRERVSDETLKRAEKNMWREFHNHDGNHNTDRRYGQKGVYKKAKVKSKDVLEEAARNVQVGEKGMCILGKVKVNQEQLNEEAIRREERKEEERENNKRYLGELDRKELQSFIKRETRFDDISYLEKRPILRGMLLELFTQQYKVFTPAIDDNDYRYDPGHCREMLYHPELKEQHKHKIFTAKAQTFSPDDEKELGRILRAWCRAGILRKQDLTDPANRSEHNHRLVLVRKQPTEGVEGAMPRPKRVCLDLRSLNSASCTHRHYMASVSDHLSMLQRGCIYTSLDLDNFFSSIPCSELGSKLLSFHCSHGSYSYLRLCQGWSSAPGVASALGARLTSVLGKDTLSLFVDDGLQVGRHRWIGEDKVKEMERYGDIYAALREDKAACLKEGLGATPSGANTGPVLGATRTHAQTGSDGSCKSHGAARAAQRHKHTGPICRNLDGGEQNISPEDHREENGDDDEEVGPMMYVSPGVDLFIKMHQLFLAIRRFNLRLSPRKLYAYRDSVDYLGFKIDRSGIKMKDKYLKTIINYPIPASAAICKNFLGICNYFASQAPFLQKYTAILYEAANRKNGRHGGPWRLDPEIELPAFHSAKVCFLRSKGVGFPELDALHCRPFRLWSDWSTMAVASTLTQVQRDENGQYRDVLIGTVGRKNPQALRSVGSPVGETHAMAFGLSKFKALLKLAVFDAFSDHVSLKFLAIFASLRGINWRIFQLISEFIFRLYTVSTAEMTVSDLVSRSNNIEMTDEEREQLGLESIKEEERNNASGSSSSGQKDKCKEGLDLKAHWAHSSWWDNSGYEEKEGESNKERMGVNEEKGQEGRESIYLGTLDQGKEVREGYVEQDMIGEARDWTIKDDRWTGEELQVDKEGMTDRGRHHENEMLCSNIGEITACNKHVQTDNCTHIKLTFPGLTDDKTFRFNCVPFRHRSQIIGVLGPKVTTDIFRTISRDEIIKEQRKDRLIVKVIDFVQSGWPTYEELKQLYPTRNLLELFFKRDLLTMSVDGLLIMKRGYQEYVLEERIVMPLCFHFQCYLLAHHTSAAFHSSVQQTYLILNFRYYMIDLTRSLRYFISRCATCIQTRVHKPNRNRKMPLYVPQWIGQVAGFNDVLYSDCSGQLPVTPLGMRYFVIFICKFSGYICATAIRGTSAEEIRQAFLESWVGRYGPPRVCITDSGSCYTSRIFKRLANDLNITHKFSNTAIPRSEYAEQGVFKIKLRLRACLNSLSDHTSWPEALTMAQLSSNSRLSMAKLTAPSEIANGQPPRLDLSWISSPGPPRVKVDSNAQIQRAVAAEHKREKTMGIWKRGRVEFPSKPIFFGKQDLDLSRLRLNDPIRLMYSEESKRGLLNENSLLSIHFLKAGLCEMLSDNQMVIYARAKETVSKANNSLFPLSAKDVGRSVFRYNPVKKSYNGVSAGLHSSWEGPLVISHVQSEVTCVVEGILRGKTVAYRTPLDHIRPFYDIDLENIPAIRHEEIAEEEREDDVEEDVDGEGERGKEGKDGDETDEEEENVNYTNCVNPSMTAGLPVIRTIKMRKDPASEKEKKEKEEGEGKDEEEKEEEEEKNALAVSLLDLPDSELVSVNPELELTLKGENVDKIKESFKEGKHLEEGLIFHKMLPFVTVTRRQRTDLERQLEEEFQLMSTKSETSEESRSPPAENVDIEWWEEGNHGPEAEEENGEKEEEDGDQEEEEEGGGDARETETTIEGEAEEREKGEEVPENTFDPEEDGKYEQRREEETPDEEESKGEEEKEDIGRRETEGEAPIVAEDPRKKNKKIRKEKWITKKEKTVDSETDNDPDNNTDEDKVPSGKTISGKMTKMGKRIADHMKEGVYWKLDGNTRRRKK